MMRAALEAAFALAVAPAPAPDDAEFEAALIDMQLASYKSGYLTAQRTYLPHVRNEPDLVTKATVTYPKELEAARQRIDAMLKEATHAGLRELRAWLVNKAAPTYQNVKFDAGYFAMRDAMVDQIDAMLKETTDAR